MPLLIIIYLAFIGLGLPDSLLGAAWPSMYEELSVPVSYAGAISMIVSFGTIFSSIQSDRLSKRWDTGKITAISTTVMAISMFGFSISHSFWALCLWAIPYGIGAGSVDAALNHYVAVHYASRHMSWLHCMWGIGTMIGPYVMSYVLQKNESWNSGYRLMTWIQMLLACILIAALPLWKKSNHHQANKIRTEEKSEVLSLRAILHVPGAIEVMLTFFCYSALESTMILWSSTYLVLHNGISSEAAAKYASLFFIGITIGRAINGFLTYRFSDTQMIRIGQAGILVGILALYISAGNTLTIAGLVCIGFGCAPVYPSIIHATPMHFGTDKSQALIGVQMASAYVGTCFMPPLFGLLANHISIKLFPIYLTILLLFMIVMHECLCKKTAR